jgi:hypothetical protein
MEFTEKEIKEVIDEYYNEHTVVGTKDQPVVINEQTAIIILKSRKRQQEFIDSVDDSHDMTDWYTEIRAPAGTPRFYSVRHCKQCEGEQMQHPAGKFTDPPLKRRCPELPPIKKDYEI